MIKQASEKKPGRMTRLLDNYRSLLIVTALFLTSFTGVGQIQSGVLQQINAKGYVWKQGAYDSSLRGPLDTFKLRTSDKSAQAIVWTSDTSFRTAAWNGFKWILSCDCSGSVVVPVTPLSITSQPASLTRTVGQSATFTVAATGGTAPYTYQWQKGTSNISGAVAVSYIIASTSIPDAGPYRVIVTDAASNSITSNAATLTVNAPALAFSTQPTDQTITDGATATFTAALTGGTTPYAYQWQLNGSNITGATSSSYTTGNAGSYRVVGSDAASNTITSNAATLTVTAPAPTVTIGYSTVDPFVNNSTAPTISNAQSFTIASGANIQFSLPAAAGDKYWVVRVPIAQPAATAWYHNTDNSGPIPGDVVRSWTVGSFRYYSSVSEFVLTYTDSIQLTH